MLTLRVAIKLSQKKPGETQPTQDSGVGKAVERPSTSGSKDSQTTKSQKRRRGRR